MNKELIIKLIERAKASAENAYCPYTNVPIGCALLVDENLIFTGCNIEGTSYSVCACAGTVAAYKAISEGYTKFRAVCFWSQDKLPYPNGLVRELLNEFSKNVGIIVANDETYSVLSLADIFPFPPEVPLE